MPFSSLIASQVFSSANAVEEASRIPAMAELFSASGMQVCDFELCIITSTYEAVSMAAVPDT
jgi:hypothetical protein